VSKSELRRLEIVAPDAIKQLREQIAQEIEADCKRREHAKGSVTSVGVNGNSVSFFEPVVCKSCANAAAIARGQDEFPLVLDGRNDGSVIHAEDLRKTAREWRREK